jgi:hypothetical protein
MRDNTLKYTGNLSFQIFANFLFVITTHPALFNIIIITFPVDTVSLLYELTCT